MGGSGSDLIVVLVSLVGSGGFLGVIVTLVKLRGDRDTAAVAQAHGANEALVALNVALTKERDYWRARYEECLVSRERLNDMLIRRASDDP